MRLNRTTITDPYIYSMGEVGMTISAPIYLNGKLYGVFAFDIYTVAPRSDISFMNTLYPIAS